MRRPYPVTAGMIAEAREDDPLGTVITFAKPRDWSHEEEIRFWVQLNEPSREDLYYANFNDILTLKEVIVGYQCDATKAQLQQALGEYRIGIQLRKVKPSYSEVEMVVDPNGVPDPSTP